MRPYILFHVIAVILLSAQFALADDCGYVKDARICWDDSTSTTLNWGYPRISVSGYQIEVRDFNWLGSVFIRITHANEVKEGMLSQGEAYIFDFSNGTTFEGVKIIADEVSNINPMPANTGVYPNDPRAKIRIKLPLEEKKIPEPVIDMSIDGGEKAGSIITAEIELKNSGKAEIVDTELTIYYDGLKLSNDYDARSGYFSGWTMAVPDIQWESVGKYRLTPVADTAVKDGFFIEVLNFSNRTIKLRSNYGFSEKTGTLADGSFTIFDFTEGREYIGFRLLGSNFSKDSAELILQRPLKNSLRRVYSSIMNENSQTIKFSFLIPSSLKKSFIIRANATGRDSSGNTYNATEQETIYSSDTLRISKRVSDSILGERIYPESYSGVGGIRSKKDITYVNIRVDNLQSYPVHGARLVDTIPPSFNFANDTDNTSISWDFDINASDFKEFRYELKAKRPGVYNLPKANLTWNEFGELINIWSDSSRTNVSGPYIGVARSLNMGDLKAGEHVQVNVSVINNGDVPTNFTIKEKIPLNATFISGKLSFSGFLNPGETAQFAYNISPSADLDFKPPEMISRNTGFEWYAPLPEKKVMVTWPIPDAPTPAASAGADVGVIPGEEKKGIIEIINERLPWLEGSTSILTLLFSIFILFKLNKINRTL